MGIKTGDSVRVMRGGERGKSGRVLRVLPRAGKLVVEKVNLHSRHLKRGAGKVGGIRSREAPLSASNVMLLCGACGHPTRLVVKGEERRCHRCKKGF